MSSFELPIGKKKSKEIFLNLNFERNFSFEKNFYELYKSIPIKPKELN